MSQRIECKNDAALRINWQTLPASQLFLDSEELGRDVLRLGSPGRSGSAMKSVNDRIARGDPMPPAIELPGSRKRIWFLPSVVAWLLEYESAVLRPTPNQ